MFKQWRSAMKCPPRLALKLVVHQKVDLVDPTIKAPHLVWNKKKQKKTKEKQRQLENGIQLAQLVSRGKSDPRWIETETIGSKCERFRSEFLPSFSIKTFFFKKVLPHSILVFTGYGYEKKKRRENGRTLRPSIDDITSRKPMNEWGMANKMKKKDQAKN